MRASLLFSLFVGATASLACGSDALTAAEEGAAGAGGALLGGSAGAGNASAVGGSGGKASAGGAAGESGGAGQAGTASGGAAGQAAPECTKATQCDKGNACLGTPLCSAGRCLYVSPPVVDDQNACTDDICDAVTGAVFHQPVTVGDGDPCTVDICDPKTGVKHDKKLSCDGCQDAKDCDDSNECTTEACVDKKCVGKALAAGAVCLQGNACRKDSVCDAMGKCIGGQAIDVADGDLCTTEACDAKGALTSKPKVVDDKNPCTTDSCDAATGNVVNAANTDDGKRCTIDSCGPNGPVHTDVVVADGDPCTDDSCDPATGTVIHASRPGCTGCKDDAACNDGRPCTSDRCVIATGKCEQGNAPDGTSCEDGVFCNGAETCKGGACSEVTPRNIISFDKCVRLDCNEEADMVVSSPLAIDDGNACTTDACDAASGPTHTPLTTNGCCKTNADCPAGFEPSDASCFPAPTCDAAKSRCVDLVGVPKSDGNACTTDGCDAGMPTHVPVVANDGNACTQNDTCDAATGAMSGTPTPTDDGNACTTDGCDSATGMVSHVPVGGCCNSSDECFKGGLNAQGLCEPPSTCTDHQCIAAPAVAVEDGSPCTTDICTPSGAVKHDSIPGCETCGGSGLSLCPREHSDGELCYPASLCDESTKTCSSPEPVKLPGDEMCKRWVCGPQGPEPCCTKGVDCFDVCPPQSAACERIK